MSNYPNYGLLDVKQVNVNAPSGFKFVDAVDSSKSVTLKVTGTIGAGNADVVLPVSGSLLTTASDVNVNKLTGLDALGQPGLHNSDLMYFADHSDGYDPKGVTLADLASFVGGGGGGLPDTGYTPANFIVADGSGDLQGVAMSQDATLSATGAVTIANGAITNAKVSGSAAIEYNKLSLSNSIVNADISGGANIAYSKLNLANSVTSNDISGTLAYNKLDLSNSVVNADLSNSANIATSKLAAGFNTAGTWEASKICSVDANADATGGRHLTVSGDVQATTGAMYLGGKSDEGSYRMVVSGGSFLIQKRETGSWVTKGTFS